jgi:hydrogenase maturation protein HypF
MLRKIRVKGLVQGVGFRPFVYQIAKRANLHGWVANTSAGVEIQVEGDRRALEDFVIALENNKPALAHIDAVQIEDLPENGHLQFDAFEIRGSIPQAGAYLPISPDISICPDCLRELFDPTDRRYRYPFINCTNCGPRFTIVEDIPYDRSKTTMRAFEMCEGCAREYSDPLDRRFHAQPVACPKCGPKVWLEANSKFSILSSKSADAAIRDTRRLLAGGQIVAVKGIGGFHLACDATNSTAVEELRRRKLRVDKPFAVMAPHLAAAEEFCYISDDERALLESRERPIVLLRKKANLPIADAVAPNNHVLGVMLPYTPLHYLIVEPEPGFPHALVMTSGNLAEEPIATENEQAREQLANLADAFCMHDRSIRTRCDDSVVRAAPFVAVRREEEVGILPLRRSRGYAPYPVHLPFDAPPILATGAELKNVFCITRDRYAFMSHHIGDLENYETVGSFEDGVAHMEHLFRIEPQTIAYDLHPNYLASRYALERAERDNLGAIGVQHHHAHIAACMVENSLDGKQPVIGIAFDGTGYGDDGAIWGGEVLIADYAGYQRGFHLDYVPLPGGDKAVREPWRVALAFLERAGIKWTDELPPVGGSTGLERRIVRQQIKQGINAPPTSSMGRLFDAVSAIIGVREKVNCEAQAAIELEQLVIEDLTGAYNFEIRRSKSETARTSSNAESGFWNPGIIDPAPVIRSIVADYINHIPPWVIATKFHNGVAALVRDVCKLSRETFGVTQVALSGGVWQNIALLTRTLKLLNNDGFTVLIHHLVPTNDGGLALGQAAIAANAMLFQEWAATGESRSVVK